MTATTAEEIRPLPSFSEIPATAEEYGFGSPLEKNGTTIIPVAVHGRASGVYVLKGEGVSWIPALDLNRMIPVMLLGELIALSMLSIIRKLTAERRVKAR